MLLLPRSKEDKRTESNHRRPDKDAESENQEGKGVEVVLRVKERPRL